MNDSLGIYLLCKLCLGVAADTKKPALVPIQRTQTPKRIEDRYCLCRCCMAGGAGFGTSRLGDEDGAGIAKGFILKLL